jgi:hypothetical protein
MAIFSFLPEIVIQAWHSGLKTKTFILQICEYSIGISFQNLNQKCK